MLLPTELFIIETISSIHIMIYAMYAVTGLPALDPTLNIHYHNGIIIGLKWEPALQSSAGIMQVQVRT